MINNIIDIKNLVKNFGKDKILKNIDISLKKGEITAYLGHNGAGKTTTIRCILGLLNYDGDIFYNNSREYSNKKFLENIGVCLDSNGFYNNMSAIDNLELYASLYNMDRNFFFKQAEKYLKELDLLDVKQKSIKTFSKGMLQKLSLIKAIQHNPDILILDEPMAGLDPQVRITIRNLLIDLKKQGKTIFITSHDLGEIEKLADRIIIIENGQVIFNKNLEEIKFFDNSYKYKIKFELINGFDLSKYCEKNHDLKNFKIEKNILYIDFGKEINLNEITHIFENKLNILEFNKEIIKLEDIYFKTLEKNE